MRVMCLMAPRDRRSGLWSLDKFGALVHKAMAQQAALVDGVAPMDLSEQPWLCCR
uniref:Uncharacterized protein n=1 Tax=Leersia perrieri TaxID=77586 RepID=A0A0D9XTG1_9ORYZ